VDPLHSKEAEFCDNLADEEKTATYLDFLLNHEFVFKLK